jgi:superfamily I DNA/RNA helicase
MMAKVIGKLDDKEKNLQLAVLDILTNILKGTKGDLKAHAMNLVDKTRKNNAKKDVKGKDAVVLATMNGSKGLEWERVWLVDMEQGIVPMLKDNVTMEAIEEERRLVYVAMTRAEKELYMSYKEGNESAFLEEIDAVVGGIW